MERSIVVEIADAVAQSKGVDTTELGYALEDYVATDALVMLATHDGSMWTLSFELPDCEVTVTSHGLVLVDGVRADTMSAGRTADEGPC